jgi:hypothetical protein
VFGESPHQRPAPTEGITAEGAAVRRQGGQRTLDLEEVFVQVERDEVTLTARGRDVATMFVEVTAEDALEERSGRAWPSTCRGWALDGVTSSLVRPTRAVEQTIAVTGMVMDSTNFAACQPRS